MKKIYHILILLGVLAIARIDALAQFPYTYKMDSRSPNIVTTFQTDVNKKYTIKVSGTYSMWPEYCTQQYGVDAMCVYKAPDSKEQQGLWPPKKIRNNVILRDDLIYFQDNKQYYSIATMNQYAPDLNFVKVRLNPLKDIGFRFENAPIPITPPRYNIGHVYEFEYTGTGKPFEMKILDYIYSIPNERLVAGYEDNCGELTVVIDEVEPIKLCSGPTVILDTLTGKITVDLGLTVNELADSNDIKANKYLNNKLALYGDGIFQCPIVECNKDSVMQDKISVALIIDKSGSMIDSVSKTDPTSRMDASKKAATTFVNGLASYDETMLYTFSTSTNKVVDWTTDKSVVVGAINQIQPEGWTFMEKTLITVIDAVENHNSAKKYIILLTDGEDTDDFTSIEDVYDRISVNQQSGNPIPIYTIALSLEEPVSRYNLEQIALRSKGKFFAVNNSDQLSSIYSTISNMLDTNRCCEFSYELQPCNSSELGKVVKRKITIMYPQKDTIIKKEIVYELDCRDTATGIEQELVYAEEDALRVSEVFPNPSSGNGVIAYDVNGYAEVSISMFDMQGKLVRTLLNGQQDTGHYRLSIDMENELPGAYTIIVRMNDHSVAKKFLLSK